MKRKRNLIGVVVAIAAVAIAVASMASASGASTVGKGHALGKTVLVNRSGLTLYSLSAETNGRFICTSSCLSLWHPLTVSRGQKPTGSRSLGTIRRPDGRTQVTYKGKPLYTFVQDHKRGQASGDGFKDVGVWHAAVVGKATSAPAPMDTTPDNYGY